MLDAKQIPFLPELAASWLGKGAYTPIVVEPHDIVLTAENRAALEQQRIRGEVIETPGHSDDSISRVLDSGPVFIGDLHLPKFASDEAAAALTRDSWRKLLDQGTRTVYPAHGEPFEGSITEQMLCD